jgi:quercetin dioxygenase-like cupin family protein
MANNQEHIESDVPSILLKDGVQVNNFQNENKPVANIDEIFKSQNSSVSWSYRVVNSDSNSATIISQLPGEGNRRHYHPNWNEWWFILDGQWLWEIEGTKFTIKKGDFVFIEKGKVHKITAIGDKPAVRLAVSREDVPHIYV